MKLPPELTQAVVKATANELADRLAPEMEKLQLFTISQVSTLLQVSEATVRKLVKEYVELGCETRRISPVVLQKLIEERTISIGKPNALP